MLSRPFPVRRKQKNGNGLQNGRHVSPADIPFHRQGIIPDGENRKGHPYFFEAKVAVFPPGRKAGALRAGQEKIILATLRYFFLPGLDAFPAGKRL